MKRTDFKWYFTYVHNMPGGFYNILEQKMDEYIDTGNELEVISALILVYAERKHCQPILDHLDKCRRFNLGYITSINNE